MISNELSKIIAKEADKQEIRELISRYVQGLDERDFTKEHFLSVFTEEAEVKLPPEGQKGIEKVIDLHERVFENFISTHHMTSDKLIEFQDSTHAHLRCNLYVTHEYSKKTVAETNNQFLIVKAVFHCGVVKSEKGWRFNKLILDVVYRD